MSAFNDALKQFVDITAEVHSEGTKQFKYQFADKFITEFGLKFVRVVCVGGYGNTSVYAFVNQENGDIIYPAGWRGPVRKASGVRGNIYDADHGRQACRTYGLRTLR